MNQRRIEIEKEMERFLSPAILSKLEEAGKGIEKRLVKNHFQFVVVHLDETRPEEVPPLIGKVVGTVVQYGAMLAGITSSLISAYLGVPSAQNDNAEDRLRLVTALIAENGNAVRIAHGQCEGFVGLLGAEGRWSYGGIIPRFSEILGKLFDSPYGTAVEIDLPPKN